MNINIKKKFSLFPEVCINFIDQIILLLKIAKIRASRFDHFRVSRTSFDDILVACR